MASIVQSPEALNLLGNLKAFKISALAPVAFQLSAEGNVIIEETYTPDDDNLVYVDIKDVVAQYLEVKVPTSNVYAQAAKDFSVSLDGVYVLSFRVIPGGVRKLADTVSNTLKQNWLTWQPKVKMVRWNQPEYLTYYHEGAGVVRVKFYLEAGGTETVTLHTAAAGEYNSYNCELEHLFSLSSHAASELLGTVDVWVENASGTRHSYIQRYVMTPDTASEHYYMSVNSLGGIDTFCFTGARNLSPSVEHESAVIDERRVAVDAEPERSWSQNTGLMGKTESYWLWEFFASAHQWAIVDNQLEAIVLDSSSVKWSDAENLASCDFSFSLSEDGRQLNSPRTAMRFNLASVPSPSGQPRVLEPRLTDYPNASIDDSLLFLTQSPYVEEWRKISLGAIRQWIKSVLPIVAVVDSLESDRPDLALSARQGSILKALIDAKVIEAGGVPFDAEPTEDSQNAVFSGGVYDAIAELASRGYSFAGVAHPLDPTFTPVARTFFVAGEEGPYDSYGSLVVSEGELAFLYFDTGWNKSTINVVAIGSFDALNAVVSGEETIGEYKGTVSPILSNFAINSNGDIFEKTSMYIKVIPVSAGEKYMLRIGANRYNVPNSHFAFSESVPTETTTGLNIIFSATKYAEYEYLQYTVPSNGYIVISYFSGRNGDNSIAPITKEGGLVNEVAKLKYNRAYGKKYCAFGSSTTDDLDYYGNEGSYATRIGKIFGMTFSNYGRSGACMAERTGVRNSIHSIIQSISDTDIDYVTIMAGANDVYADDVTFNGINETALTDFYGAYKASIEHLLALNPLCRIGIIIPFSNVSSRFGEMVDACYEIAEYYGLPILDINKLGFDGIFANYNTHYGTTLLAERRLAYGESGGTAHLNGDGMAILTDVTIKWFRGL